jgi:hypothetical protein
MAKTKAKAEVRAAVPSQTHSSDSSAQTSASGQATPASGSVSGLDAFGREDILDRGRARDHSPDPLLPFGSGRELGSRASHAAADGDSNGDGDGENDSEVYELQVFDGDVTRDHGEYNSDDDDDDDDDNKDAHGVGRDRGSRRYSGRRPSDSTVASFQLYTPDEERAIVRKFDRRLVIFLAFCYMLSFVDRSSAFPFLLYSSVATLARLAVIRAS